MGYTGKIVTPVHQGPAEPARAMTGKNDEPLNLKTRYMNFSDKTITVVFRSGFSVIVPPQPLNANFINHNKFVIRQEWFFGDQVKENVRATLNGIDENASLTLQMLKQVSTDVLARSSFRGYQTGYEYQIDTNLIAEYNGALYHVESDIVLTTNANRELPLHPFSDHGREERMLMNSPAKFNPNTFAYHIEIVDNDQRFGARFINIANNIYCIRPIEDANRRNAIYIGSANVYAGKHAKGDYSVITIELDDSEAQEKHGIFKSHEEALNLGDLKKGRELELVNLDHQLVSKKRENEQLKAANEASQLEASKELLGLKLKFEKEEQLRKERDARIKEQDHEMKMLKDRHDLLITEQRLAMERKHEDALNEQKRKLEEVKRTAEEAKHRRSTTKESFDRWTLIATAAMGFLTAAITLGSKFIKSK